MSESLENKFFGDGRGSSDRKSEAEIAQKGAKVEIDPNIPVRHVEGSKLYHPDAKCETLATEKQQFSNHGIGYLFKHLTGKESLGLCPDCNPERFITLPKKVPFDGR